MEGSRQRTHFKAAQSLVLLELEGLGGDPLRGDDADGNGVARVDVALFVVLATREKSVRSTHEAVLVVHSERPTDRPSNHAYDTLRSQSNAPPPR